MPKTNSPNLKQTCISGLVMLVLASIAMGIWVKQASFYPSVHIGLSDISRMAAPEMTSLVPLPPELEPMSPMEAFSPANVSDKINGKAELYLAAGFHSLQCQRFKQAAQPDIWAELLVYNMKTASNAFSVFSTQKRSDSQPIGIGDHGYQTENALFFAHGPFYVEIVAAAVSKKSRQLMHQIAEAFIDHTPVQKATAADSKELFPASHRLPGSQTLISRNVFGFEQLDQVYTAQYKINDIEVTAFLSRRSSADEAQRLAGAYGEFLLSFGGARVDSPLEVPGVQVISIMNSIEIIFVHGHFIAGVHEAENLAVAEQLALLLSKRIQETER